VSEKGDKPLSGRGGGKDRQQGNQATGAIAEDALAYFAERAISTMRAVSGPLEILDNLIYLAGHSQDDSERRAEYLAEAESVAQSVAGAYADLLKDKPTDCR
jgi:hypothetical protein